MVFVDLFKDGLPPAGRNKKTLESKKLSFKDMTLQFHTSFLFISHQLEIGHVVIPI